jgi:HTH-type transcriptional regulator / antitoxin HigA
MSKTIAPKASRGKGASEDYLRLVRALPIRPLKTAKEYVAAQRVLDGLVGREDLNPGKVDYVAGLARFVEDYEREHRMGQLRRLSPMELLRHLMEENDMNTSDLGYVLGSRGLASEVLGGKRGLSKMLIRRLSERFNVDPGLFLAATD